jgi:hypothetical protein
MLTMTRVLVPISPVFIHLDGPQARRRSVEERLREGRRLKPALQAEARATMRSRLGGNRFFLE